MLEFFRTYQRYFFLVITVVVIVSFSFFGTFNTIDSNQWREQIAFTAVNGKEMTRSDVDEMAIFLATDTEDKALFGGAWGLNFLNDGVIRKDFLESGLAQELANAYMPDLQDDLQKRLEKEKRYSLYTHPSAKFISATNAWAYLMPEMNTHFDLLRNASNGTEAFNAKVKLFLAEKALPSSALRQVLSYQEKQFNWISPDPKLQTMDLSLFGYHTLEDWFGPHFTRLVSQFIINTAILAEAKGYEVSKAEVIADLVRSTETSYQQYKNNPNLGVRNADEYLNEQLHRMNMDQARAIKVWRQVMLFRRYFDDVGSAALVDTLAYNNFNGFTQESLTVDLYHLPKEFQLNSYTALQNFEIYLNAIAKRSKTSTDLPTEFLSVAEIEKNYPELIQKRYLVEVSQVDKKNLQAKISLKETWAWEIDEKNWAALKKQFPELGVKKGDTREERFAALESLDTVTRSRVDSFSRAAIVDTHPDWVSKALEEAQPKKMAISLHSKGGKDPLEGMDSTEKRKEFGELLDHAALGEKPAADSKLNHYTANGQVFYKITVLERSSDPAVLTFAEANQEGVLDEVRNRILSKHYEATREKTPVFFQNADKSWKNFADVKELVAEQYFEKLVRAIQQDAMVGQDQNMEFKPIAKDQAASLRFYAYLSQAKDKLEKDPSLSAQLAHQKNTQSETALSNTKSLANQWQLEKETHEINRSSAEKIVGQEQAFTLPVHSWSNLKTPPNGDLMFFQVTNRGIAKDQEVALVEQTRRAQLALSDDAQRQLMSHVLKEIKAKNAISLDYLVRPQAEEGPSSTEEVQSAS